MAYSLLLLACISTTSCMFFNFQITVGSGSGGGDGDGGEVVRRSSTTPLFIFGDSTVNPGNNNLIETIPGNKANFKPYGLNGFFQEPTGRFSDGRIVVDFIAEYAKMPLIPPYNQPSVGEYIHGVNFASGGAGILSSTNKGLVIDLKTQLKNFEEVYKSLTQKLGSKEATREMISDAIYFISIGSNDYMGGYLVNPTMRQLHPPHEYVTLVIGNLTLAIQEGMNACCGTGPYRGIYTCGGNKEVSEYKLCENANDYVFFDSFHGTEKVYEQLANVMWDGTISTSVLLGPSYYNLKDLLFDKENIIIADVVDINYEEQIF